MSSLVALLPQLSSAELEENSVSAVIAANAALASIATVAVALRFWSRRLKRHDIKADDILILFALVGVSRLPL